MALPIVVNKSTGTPYARTTPAIPLYDTECLKYGTSINGNELDFYSQALGNADASNLITRKSLGDTNLKQMRQLPQANRFDCHWINIKLLPGVGNSPSNGCLSLGDYLAIFNGAWVTMTISNIVVAQCLLTSVPSGPTLNFDGVAGTTANPAATGSLLGFTGVTHRSNGLVLKLNAKAFPVIGPTESFDLNINWAPTTAATAPTLSQNVRVIVETWGVFYRPI